MKFINNNVLIFILVSAGCYEIKMFHYSFSEFLNNEYKVGGR